MDLKTFKGKVTLVYGKDQSGRTAYSIDLIGRAKKAIYLTDFSTDTSRLPDDVLVGRIGDLESYKECGIFEKKLFENLGIELIVVDSATYILKLIGKKTFTKLVVWLETLAKELNLAVVLVGDLYLNFETNKFRISGGGILKVCANNIIKIERRGPKRFVVWQRPLEKEVEFKIQDGGVKWE